MLLSISTNPLSLPTSRATAYGNLQFQSLQYLHSGWGKVAEEDRAFQAKLRAARDKMALDLAELSDEVQAFKEVANFDDMVRQLEMAGGGLGRGAGAGSVCRGRLQVDSLRGTRLAWGCAHVLVSVAVKSTKRELLLVCVCVCVCVCLCVCACACVRVCFRLGVLTM